MNCGPWVCISRRRPSRRRWRIWIIRRTPPGFACPASHAAQGEVDPRRLIDSASGEMKNLAGFSPLGDGAVATVAGFPPYRAAGTYSLETRADPLSHTDASDLPIRPCLRIY
ncbi:LpqN/LpqT family lipoprotein [Nocardia sp. NPDC050630]|uniref:LpqN/LpqT family lipoprotein n=1 Tax=Nocardia sp. NPDC050630 TaxID=3364321 RepID=UPI003788599A